VSWLVLFDVDGTLLLTHDEVYVEANRLAMTEVFGAAPDGADVPGDTATAHTRRALLAAGFANTEIDAGLPRWCDAFTSSYLRLLADADTSHWELATGAEAAIAETERHALLTGNPPAVAFARMERLGLAEYFPSSEGAFGCERENRIDLFALARQRAGDWPANRTVAVGDTPLDVSSAHAAGCRCVAVTTGQYARHHLNAADVVIPELTQLADALRALED
jgi:phosphoglycolate phosphatase